MGMSDFADNVRIEEDGNRPRGGGNGDESGTVIEPRIVADAHRLLDQAVAIADEGDIVVGNAERLRLYHPRCATGRRGGPCRIGIPAAGTTWSAQRVGAPRGAVGRGCSTGEDAAFFAGHWHCVSGETGLVREVDQAVVARMRDSTSGLIAIAEDTLAGYEQGRTPSTSVRQSWSA